MGFPNIRFRIPDFHTYFGEAAIRKWIEGEMKEAAHQWCS